VYSCRLNGLFISVINQLDGQNFCFTISLFHASTCFEHMCSSSGGKNCISQPLVSTHSVGGRPVYRLRLHETATYRCDDTRGCVMQFWPPDDEHMCSKHMEAWNKLIVKQKFCASSWLITDINILRCTVSKTSKKVNGLGQSFCMDRLGSLSCTPWTEYCFITHWFL